MPPNGSLLTAETILTNGSAKIVCRELYVARLRGIAAYRAYLLAVDDDMTIDGDADAIAADADVCRVPVGGSVKTLP